MILASVIVGMPLVYEESDEIERPDLMPFKEGYDRKTYDSVQGKCEDSDLFAIYSNGRAYPKYYIEYV